MKKNEGSQQQLEELLERSARIVREDTPDLPLARKLLEKAISIAPESSRAHCALGRVFLLLEEADLAETTFRRALECNPKSGMAKTGLGLALLKLDRFKEGLAALEESEGLELSEVVPEEKSDSRREAEALLKKGQEAFYRDEPDFSVALMLFRHAVRVAPGWAEAQYHCGMACDMLKRFKDAERYYDATIDLCAEHFRAHLALGVVLLDSGRLEEAKSHLCKALELKPPYGAADTRLYLAEVLWRMKDIRSAREQLEYISEMKPMYPSYDAPMDEARRQLKWLNDGRAAEDYFSAAEAGQL